METEMNFCIFSIKEVQEYVCNLLEITGPEDPKIKKTRILSPTYSRSPHFNKPVKNQIYHRLQKGYWILTEETDRMDAFVNLDVEEIICKLNHFEIPKI